VCNFTSTQHRDYSPHGAMLRLKHNCAVQLRASKWIKVASCWIVLGADKPDSNDRLHR